MIKNNIPIESPRESGRETEFFLQSDPKNSAACTAHIHTAVELLYVKEGSYDVTLDNAHYHIEQGDLILFCSGAIHYVVTGQSESNSYYVIKIPPSFFIDFAKGDAGAEYAMRFSLNHKGYKCLWTSSELAGGEIKAVLDRLVLESEQGRYAYGVAIKLKIMELLLAILRADAPSAPLANDRTTGLIYSIMNYVQLHYSEDLEEKELARRNGMSYSYFSRSFKRVTGMTFKNYLNRTRISKAEQMLLANGGSITEAATACGYNSVSYFISVYRSVTGKTPYQAVKAGKHS